MKKSGKKKLRMYLAVYLGTESAMEKFMKLPSEVRKEREAQGMRAWRAWAKANAKAIVHPGGPLGSTKRIDRKGIASARNGLAAFVIVQAESHAAAAKLFKSHPHFMLFPGDSVEVMECLEIPGA